MEENLKILLLSIASMSFYFMSTMLLLKVRMTGDELPVYARKDNTKAMENLTKRLQVILDGLDADTSKENQIANITGKKMNIVGQAKHAVISTFAENELTSSMIRTMVIALSISSILSLLALKTFGPLVATFLFISLFAMILSSVNVASARKDVKLQADILTLMEVNFLHFTNSPNFEESVKKTLESLPPTSQTYKAMNRFLDKVYGLNIPKIEAIREIKEELGNIPHVNQYFETVIKAEENDPAYKKSLAGIPDFYAMLLAQKKDFANAMTMIFATYCVMGAIIVGITLKVAVENFAILIPSMERGPAFYLTLGGFALYSVSGIVMFMATLKKQEKRWG